MIGGLLKSTSRLALIAAAGMFAGGLGVTSAKAADLGGDCCADLEERVATLEATTVRKGNRLVTLTLSGHVNRGIMWYDDGSMTGTRFFDQIMSHSRFRLLGSAKISPTWSAGYYQEFEFSTASNFAVSQLDDRGFNAAGGNLQGSSPFNIAVRQSHWWLKNEQLGTVSVGRVNTATKDMPGIELGNIAMVANSDFTLSMFSFLLRPKGTTGREGLPGSLAAAGGGPRLGAFRNSNADNLRTDGVRYDSPTWMGFTLSAAYGDDYIWDVALRYANTFQGGFQVALGVGYYSDMDEGLCNATTDVTRLTAPGVSCINPAVPKPGRREQNTFKLNASVWHQPSGIFISGAYQNLDFDGTGGIDNVVGTLNQRRSVDSWWVGAGVRKNFFGIGTTSIFGEYGMINHGIDGTAQNFTTPSGAGLNFAGGITDSELTRWGFGVVQNIDPAAMSLYIHYINYTPEVTGCTVLNPATCGTAANPARRLELEDLRSVQVGAIIRF
jgi:predicted porin